MFKDPLLASSVLALTCAAIAGVAAVIWFKYGKKKTNLKDKTEAAIKADKTEAELDKAFSTAEGTKKEFVAPSIEEVAASEYEMPAADDTAEVASEYEMPNADDVAESMTESVAASEYEMPAADDSKEEE